VPKATPLKSEVKKISPIPVSKLKGNGVTKVSNSLPLTSLRNSAVNAPMSRDSTKVKDERVEIQNTERKMRQNTNRGSIREVKKIENKLSPYVKSVLSPFEYAPSQIPDANTFPSATGSLTQKFTIEAIQASATNGITPNVAMGHLGNSFAVCLGSYYGTPTSGAYGDTWGGNLIPTYIPNSNGLVNGVYAGGVCDVDFSGNVTNLFNRITGANTTISLIDNVAYGLQINSGVINGFGADVQLIRPVSAAIKAQCIGPALTMSGYLVGASIPNGGLCNGNSFDAPTNVTFQAILNHPTAQIVPSIDGAIQTNYSPTDNTNYEYMRPLDVTSDSYPDQPEVGNAHKGELWIVGVGLQDGESILIEMTVGFEFIPSLAILDLVDVTPSWVHTNEMDQAENLAAVVPKVVKAEISDTDSFVSNGPNSGTGNTLARFALNKMMSTKSTASLGSVNHIAPLIRGTLMGSSKVSNWLDDSVDVAKSGSKAVKAFGGVLKDIISTVMDVVKDVI